MERLGAKVEQVGSLLIQHVASSGNSTLAPLLKLSALLNQATPEQLNTLLVTFGQDATQAGLLKSIIGDLSRMSPPDPVPPVANGEAH